MQILLSQIDWSNLHTFTVENSYQNFIENINRILNTVAPLKKVTIRPSNVIKGPWMTPRTDEILTRFRSTVSTIDR